MTEIPATPLSAYIHEEPHLPRWLRGIGWAGLLCLVLGALFPRTTALMNMGGGLGAVAILLQFKNIKTERLGNGIKGFLAIATVVFLAITIFNVLYPAAAELPDKTALARCGHQLWHTLRGFITAWLCIMLLRSKGELANLLWIICLVTICICVWAPLYHALCNYPLDLRLTGTKGYPNRYATMLYLSAFCFWILLTTPSMRNHYLPKWVDILGFIMAVATPLFLLKKKSPPSMTPNVAWLNDKMEHLATPFHFLAFRIAIFALVLWIAIRAVKSARFVILCGGLFLIFENILLSVTRLKVILLILSAAAIVLINGKRKKLTLSVLGVVCAAGLAVILLHPRSTQTISMKHRLYIWDGTVNMLKENFAFGVGYGSDSFEARWSDYRPDPTKFGIEHLGMDYLKDASHAHNLWLEILSERGIAGLIAFHLLWIALLLHLFGKPKETNLPPELAESVKELHLTATIAGIMLALLFFEGMLTYSLRLSNEILYGMIIGIGLSAQRLLAREENQNNAAPRS